MTRKGVPHACDKKCSPWCALKEKLDALWDRTHNAFTSLNGVSGDGSGNLQIEAGENISLEQSGNKIKITGEGGGVEYTARSPLDIYENEIFARMGPVQEGWSWLVSADNIDKQIKAQIQAEVSARDTQIGTQVSSEAAARAAADDDLQDQIDDIEDGTVAVGRATHAVDADTARTADALSGVLPQANGGTGGTGLKTINGESIVGSGDIDISGGGGVDMINERNSSYLTFTRTSYTNKMVYLPSGSAAKYIATISMSIYSSDIPEDNIITIYMSTNNSASIFPVHRQSILKDRDNSLNSTHVVFTVSGTIGTAQQTYRLISISLSAQPTTDCHMLVSYGYSYIGAT